MTIDAHTHTFAKCRYFPGRKGLTPTESNVWAKNKVWIYHSHSSVLNLFALQLRGILKLYVVVFMVSIFWVHKSAPSMGEDHNLCFIWILEGRVGEAYTCFYQSVRWGEKWVKRDTELRWQLFDAGTAGGVTRETKKKKNTRTQDATKWITKGKNEWISNGTWGKISTNMSDVLWNCLFEKHTNIQVMLLSDLGSAVWKCYLYIQCPGGKLNCHFCLLLSKKLEDRIYGARHWKALQVKLHYHKNWNLVWNYEMDWGKVESLPVIWGKNEFEITFFHHGYTWGLNRNGLQKSNCFDTFSSFVWRGNVKLHSQWVTVNRLSCCQICPTAGSWLPATDPWKV